MIDHIKTLWEKTDQIVNIISGCRNKKCLQLYKLWLGIFLVSVQHNASPNPIRLLIGMEPISC